MKLTTTLFLVTVAVTIQFGACQVATAGDEDKLAELKTSLEKSGVAMNKAGIEAYLQQLTDITVAKNLILQLGSDNFAEREAAQRSLLRLPITPTELLEKATESSDPEVAFRAKKVLQIASARKKVDHTQTVENALRAISSLKLSGLTEEIAATVAQFPNEKQIVLAAENAMLAVVSKDDIPFLSSQINPKSYGPLQKLSVRALRHLKEPKLADQFQKWAGDEELGEFARLESALALADLDDRRSLDFYSTFDRMAKSHFQERRNSDKALEIREGMLALRQKFLGPEDRLTLDAMIGVALSNSYVRPQKEQYLETRREILRISRKVHGPKHRVTLLAILNLGAACHNVAKHKDSAKLPLEAAKLRKQEVKMYEEAVAGYREVRGLKSTLTLETMQRLASRYYQYGQKEKSLALREEILAARRDFNGPKHAETLAAMEELAKSYEDAGRKEEAMKLQEEVREIRQKGISRLFKQAGYRFHGQVAGFRATSCPVQTESDLIVAGRLPKDGNHRYQGKNVVWRVNANEVDVLHGLAHQNGATHWITFGIPHSSGSIYATAYNSNADDKFRYRPCVITENNEWVEIQTPPADIILLSDVNDAGMVVGYRHVAGRYLGFEWTKGAGYQLLGNTRSTYVPRAINQQGMIVGYTSTGDGRVKVPHVWMPPEKQDGDRKPLTLTIPADFFDATCPDVNNKGVVLISCSKKHGTFYLETPYLWSRDKGYTALPHSRQANNRPVAISTDGSVLINSWDNPEQNYLNPNRVETSYLYRDGKTTRLPDYPGADQTTYLFLSDDGLLVGLAAFKGRNNPHAMGHLNLTFLISVDK